MNLKLQNYLSVGIFAFFGASLRAWLNIIWSFAGTMTANIIGCFCLAFLTYFFLEFREGHNWLATGLSTGFVGAFTTFSTFQLETLKQLQAGISNQAMMYFFGSMIFGLFSAFLGMLVGKYLGQKIAGKSIMGTSILAAGFGAIFGAVGRYWLTNYGKKHWSKILPWATLIINLSGAFLLGILFAKKLPSFLYAFLGTGVLGGYTTFSTMNVELLQKLKDKKYPVFWLYLVTSYLGGFICVVVGFILGRI